MKGIFYALIVDASFLIHDFIFEERYTKISMEEEP